MQQSIYFLGAYLKYFATFGLFVNMVPTLKSLSITELISVIPLKLLDYYVGDGCCICQLTFKVEIPGGGIVRDINFITHDIQMCDVCQWIWRPKIPGYTCGFSLINHSRQHYEGKESCLKISSCDLLKYLESY